MMTATRGRNVTADPAALGRRLREHRTRRGWTQEQLAAAAELSRNTISAIERGAGRGCWYTVCRLANALGVTPAELG